MINKQRAKKLITGISICSIVCVACASCISKNTLETNKKPIKISSVQSQFTGALENGIDLTGVTFQTIQNMNMIHRSQTYSYIQREQQQFNELIDQINNQDWQLSSKSYDDICKLKGIYMAIIPYSSGEMKYAVMLNEVVIDGLDLSDYAGVQIDQSGIDKQVQAYLVEKQQDGSLKCYQTSNTQLYNKIMELGDSAQEERKAQTVQLASQETYQQSQGKYTFFTVKFNREDQLDTDRQTELELGVQLLDFITNYFDSQVVNLYSKLDPYSLVDDSEYSYQINVLDQYNYPVYVLYLLNDSTVRAYNCMNGDSWVSDSQELADGILDWAKKLSEIGY